MALGVVVIDDSESVEQLVRTADKWAAGSGARIILLRMVNEEEYISEVQQKAQSRGEMDSLDEIVASENERLKQLQESLLNNADTESEVDVQTGEVPEDILEYAREVGADHLFITGTRRSPVGKALFGDEIQKLLLNFQGPVTSILS